MTEAIINWMALGFVLGVLVAGSWYLILRRMQG